MAGILEERYWRDYYQLKLQEVENEKTEEEIFNDLVDNLSRKELPLSILKPGLKNFAKTTQGGGFNFLRLELIGKELYTLKGIDKFKHLQEICIKNNNITKLEPLKAHRCLAFLDASQNLLKNLEHFVPADTLVKLNLGFNRFEVIPDFSSYRYLKELRMNDNQLKKIEGVGSCPNLAILDLSNNMIETIEGIQSLRLKELYLQGNKIEILSGMSKLLELLVLNLARNGVRKLDELSTLENLRFLDLSCNKITKIRELDSIKDLPFLTNLDLCYNSCQNLKFYKTQVIYKIPQLRKLDGVMITAQDIAKAEIFYGHDTEEKKTIFNQILENEEFVDRRLYKSQMLDPETESEPGDYDFFEKYDEEGKMLQNRPKYLSMNTKYPFNMTRSTKEPFNSTISMNFIAKSVNKLQNSMNKSKISQKGSGMLGLSNMIFVPN